MNARLLSQLLVAIAIAVGGSAKTHAQKAAGFSIRVDPSVAREVNMLLANVAESAVTDVPEGYDVELYLQNRCGMSTPPAIAAFTAMPNGKQRVIHASCARFGGSRVVLVEPGLTLEGIAARWGLRASTATTLRIKSGAGNPKRNNILPEAMLPGDEVVLPQTSIWTDIRLRPEAAINDRDGLVLAIADAIGCVGNAGDCVRQKGVLLLPHGEEETALSPDLQNSPESPPNDPIEVPPVELEEMPPRISDGGGVEIRSVNRALQFSDIRNEPRHRDFPISASVEYLDKTGSTTPIQVSTTEMSNPVSAEMPTGVAAEQWPYDVNRVAKVLFHDREWRKVVTTGVADGGLGDASGAPMPPGVRAQNSEELKGKGNDDDDFNEYVDDFYGAGVKRSDDGDLATDMLGTGKLNLCPHQVAFETWSQKAFNFASHGTLVSSIAAGWPLRNQDADTLKLPRIQFYRMVTNQCDPGTQFHVRDAEITKAIYYLFGQKIDVVNLSMKVSVRGVNRDLKSAARSVLNGDARILVLAAGNGDSDDLDKGELCPACLGSPKLEFTAKRVLVVGAAERTLFASPGSNQGEKTIRFYAPGQAIGVNILGLPVTNSESSTSYAAPMVAFAVALLKSYGLVNYWEITERLEAASWPLLRPDGSEHPTARVIDLTKVVAFHTDVVETIVNENGERVRRSFVGAIDERIQDLGLCEGQIFSRAKVHSIRFGSISENGYRTARWENRFDEEIFPQDGTESCRSTGTITIDDVLEGKKVISLQDVTQVLLYWSPPPPS